MNHLKRERVMKSILQSIVQCESIFQDDQSKYLFTECYAISKNETIAGLSAVLPGNYTYLQNALIILRPKISSTLPTRQ